MLGVVGTLEFDVNLRFQDILGFNLLINLNKEERILVKCFLDDYACNDEGIHHLFRVDEGV